MNKILNPEELPAIQYDIYFNFAGRSNGSNIPFTKDKFIEYYLQVEHRFIHFEYCWDLKVLSVKNRLALVHATITPTLAPNKTHRESGYRWATFLNGPQAGTICQVGRMAPIILPVPPKFSPVEFSSEIVPNNSPIAIETATFYPIKTQTIESIGLWAPKSELVKFNKIRGKDLLFNPIEAGF